MGAHRQLRRLERGIARRRFVLFEIHQYTIWHALGIAHSQGGGSAFGYLGRRFLKGKHPVGKFAFLLFSLVHSMCVLFFLEAKPDRSRENGAFRAGLK